MGEQSEQRTQRGRPFGSGRSDADTSGLTFPDASQTELEQSLQDLTRQADAVLRAQGRLRALLRANSLVVSDLSLPVVLRRIVEAAKELVGAHYAALGVVREGRLEAFIHTGMDDETVARIGHLPEGRGVLGLLINHPEPIRLADLAQHPSAAGFPVGHPPMTSFLGAPIRVRERIFGNLYLTQSDRGEFTEEDQQLVVALASAAGVAIENARLFEETDAQRRWLALSTELTQDLLGREAGLLRTLHFAVTGARADAGMVALLQSQDEETLRVEAATGLYGAAEVGRTYPADASPMWDMIRSGKPWRSEVTASPLRDLAPSEPLGPVALVPLLSGERVDGCLCVARAVGQPPFNDLDVDQLASFAATAGVALQLDQARSAREELRRAEERDRIAADLHDHVIQALVAVGLGLQQVKRQRDGIDLGARLDTYVELLRDTIQRIRATISSSPALPITTADLRRRFYQLLEEEAAALGFVAEVTFACDTAEDLPGAVVDDALAVLREALSNAARHSGASSIQVEFRVADEAVVAAVTDNGVGIGEVSRASGLANMRRRAEVHHGSFDLSRPDDGGTRLVWTVPLTS